MIKNLFSQAVIALYFPIILFSGIGCYLYSMQAILPAIRNKTFKIEKHAVAITAITALLAQFVENSFYAFIRVVADLSIYLNRLEFVAPMKLLILLSCIFAIGVYNKASKGNPHILELSAGAFFVWMISWFCLIFWN